MLKFKFGEVIISFEEEDFKVEKRTSKHTGKELTDYEIEMKLRGKENRDWLNESIKKNLYKLNNNEDIVDKYEGKIISHSYSSQSNIYNYKIKLFEKEDLEIKKLVIDDLELEPYEYEEEYIPILQQNEYLKIHFKAKVNYSKFMKLFNSDLNSEPNSEPKYFEVTREGINDNIVNMRFGRIIWSNLEDTEKVKIDIYLFEKFYDHNRENSLGKKQPKFDNLIDKTVYKNKLFDILIDYLIDEDILSKAKFKELKEKAKEKRNEGIFELREVSDVDKY